MQRATGSKIERGAASIFMFHNFLTPTPSLLRFPSAPKPPGHSFSPPSQEKVTSFSLLCQSSQTPVPESRAVGHQAYHHLRRHPPMLARANAWAPWAPGPALWPSACPCAWAQRDGGEYSPLKG